MRGRKPRLPVVDTGVRGPQRGIYETSYGNAAYVSGPKAKTAYDLDMGERIPLYEVNLNKFLREAENGD